MCTLWLLRRVYFELHQDDEDDPVDALGGIELLPPLLKSEDAEVLGSVPGNTELRLPAVPKLEPESSFNARLAASAAARRSSALFCASLMFRSGNFAVIALAVWSSASRFR